LTIKELETCLTLHEHDDDVDDDDGKAIEIPVSFQCNDLKSDAEGINSIIVKKEDVKN
jgi:hypothetical protein